VLSLSKQATYRGQAGCPESRLLDFDTLASVRSTTQPKSLLNRRSLPQVLHAPEAAGADG